MDRLIQKILVHLPKPLIFAAPNYANASLDKPEKEIGL